MPEDADVVAMLVVPSEYVRYINQVAGLTTRDIIFVKRKFASRDGYELANQPIDQCTSVAYFDERPLVTIISGAFLTALLAFIVISFAMDWEVLSGTRITDETLIALGTLGLVGVQRMFSARRHRLVFTMQDQTKLRWASRSGEYELWKQSAQQILDYARKRRLLTGG